MKLKIEIDIKDNEGPLNERCRSVVFSDEWMKLSSEEKVYFYGLVKLDIDYAIELENEEERTG